MLPNKNQKIIIWAALVIIIVMGIFPPWIRGEYVSYGSSSSFKESESVYRFLFVEPSPRIKIWNNGVISDYVYRLDYARLFMQWLMVIIVVMGLFFLFREAPKKKS